ncbi:MAG: hypothetical protein ABIJ48_04100 [Actinomycetota bacterium]
MALAVVGVVAVAALIVGPLVWLRGGGDRQDGGPGVGTVETSAPGLSTLPSTTLPTTVTETSDVQATSSTTSAAGGEWTSVGEPISDDEFAAVYGEEPVPGSARRLAWTVGYDGQYTLGLFAAQRVDADGLWYCLVEYGSTSEGAGGEFGGSQCTHSETRFAEWLAFGVGGGGTCGEPAAHMWSVWGVPQSADQVVFELSDGTRLTGQVVNGIAQVATGRDVAVNSITFEGATAEQLAEIERMTTANHQTCAELNDPDLPG